LQKKNEVARTRVKKKGGGKKLLAGLGEGGGYIWCPGGTKDPHAPDRKQDDLSSSFEGKYNHTQKKEGRKLK